MGVFHFGNAYEIDAADGTKFVVWAGVKTPKSEQNLKKYSLFHDRGWSDACPNFHSNGATHLFDIRTLRSRTGEEIKQAFEGL